MSCELELGFTVTGVANDVVVLEGDGVTAGGASN